MQGYFFMKKYTLSALVVLVALLALSGWLWYGKHKEKQLNQGKNTVIESQSVPVSQAADFSEKNKVLARAKITGVQSIDATYKKVTISDGQVVFSFDVPNGWLVETRNSGEVQMNESELRDFFATKYDGDIKTNSALSGDYWDFTWDMLKDMPYDKMSSYLVKARNEVTPGFPNASVSASGHIVYYDVNTQTDFYLLSEATDKQYYDGKPLGIENAKWSDVKNDYPNGSFKSVYIPIRNSQKMLFIRVRIETSESLKQEIDRMLNTLKFE